MSHNLLQGKRGIIFGALDSDSIAWKVAEQVYKEGGRFTLSNAPIALRMGEIQKLGEACEAEVIPADATSIEELEELIDKSMETLGGKLDFILHAIGMSSNIRKKRPYTDLNYDWLLKSMDVSAISFHKVMQTAWKKEAMNDWGSIVGLSYIGAQRAYSFYSDMADSKAALESIARSFGYHFGRRNNVRVNTISQSPTPTKAGSGIQGFDKFSTFADKMSPLGNATADECADACVLMFSDLSRKITMQNIFHDGGYSTTGISEDVMDMF